MRSASARALGPASEAVMAEAVREVTDRVPAAKLMLGVATYGYDWGAGPGTSITAAEAVDLARRTGAEPRWDPEAAGTTSRWWVLLGVLAALGLAGWATAVLWGRRRDGRPAVRARAARRSPRS